MRSIFAAAVAVLCLLGLAAESQAQFVSVRVGGVGVVRRPLLIRSFGGVGTGGLFRPRVVVGANFGYGGYGVNQFALGGYSQFAVRQFAPVYHQPVVIRQRVNVYQNCVPQQSFQQYTPQQFAAPCQQSAFQFTPMQYAPQYAPGGCPQQEFIPPPQYAPGGCGVGAGFAPLGYGGGIGYSGYGASFNRGFGVRRF